MQEWCGQYGSQNFIQWHQKQNVRPVLSDCAVEGYSLSTLYYLVRKIYPKILCSVPLHPDPRPRREKMCGIIHYLAKNATERLFGVLLTQRHMLYSKWRLQCVKERRVVVKACCIRHSMITDALGYKDTMQFRKELEKYDGTDFSIREIMLLECRLNRARQCREDI